MALQSVTVKGMLVNFISYASFQYLSLIMVSYLSEWQEFFPLSSASF